MTNFCKLTRIEYARKTNTKTVYVETKRSTEIIDREKYDRIVDASPFFRRLGGSERAMKEYTQHGYITVQIVSTSPDRSIRIRRIFDFDL